MEYKLLKTDNMEGDDDIAKQINEHLNDGYSLHGTTSVVTVPDHRVRGGHRIVISQAVLKGNSQAKA